MTVSSPSRYPLLYRDASLQIPEPSDIVVEFLLYALIVCWHQGHQMQLIDWSWATACTAFFSKSGRFEL